jgi:hypothetical protein
MEPKIRNVDPTAVKKVDELAKKHGQSWQQFSKNQVHTLLFLINNSTEKDLLKI